MASGRHSKVISMRESIGQYVRDGDVVYFGGDLVNIPFAAAHEIVRQHKTDLTITQCTFDELADLLIGAGCVRRVITSYLWSEFYGSAWSFRRAVEQGIPKKVEIEDFSNAAMVFMFKAGAFHIPFIPIRSLVGSDIEKNRAFLRKKVGTVTNPFDEREDIRVVPALNPDVAVIHVQQCDEKGNAQVAGLVSTMEEGVFASKRTIVTTEKIVSSREISKLPLLTIASAFQVDAVVECPYGAHPASVLGHYSIDRRFRGDYSQASRTLNGFESFLDKWVYGVADRGEYLRLVRSEYGDGHLEGLREERRAEKREEWWQYA